MLDVFNKMLKLDPVVRARCPKNRGQAPRCAVSGYGRLVATKRQWTDATATPETLIEAVLNGRGA